MRITSITKPNPHFKTSQRVLFRDRITNELFEGSYANRREGSDIVFSNFTYFFRDDFCYSPRLPRWVNFVEFLSKEFKDVPKVNVYNFASSDGSEAYSFIIAMNEELGEQNASKFFPIKAFDHDPYIVKKAQSGHITATTSDINSINEYSHYRRKKYFEKVREGRLEFELVASDILKNAVEFSEGDFLEKLDEIEGSNSLIMCRNFWPYMPSADRDAALDKLAKKVDKSSIVVIGDYDVDSLRINSELQMRGFEEVEDKVFKKKKNRKGLK